MKSQRKKKADVVVNKNIKELNIVTDGIYKTVSLLSGGNQQKILLSMWLGIKPKLLIVDEPTKGVDVGAKFEIYSLINNLIEEGMSIIMISSELPELLAMSDRIYVVAEGVVTGELSGEDATQESVMKLAI